MARFRSAARLSILISLPLVLASAHAETGASVDVGLSPAGSFVGKTAEVVGQATLDGDTVRAENVVVKLASLKTGIELRDRHMKEKYLEIAKFPDAILVKAIGRGGNGKGRIKIRGIEKEVAGKYKISSGELSAEFPIKFSDFGITGIKYMGVGVKDDGVVRVSLPVVKK